MRHAVLLMLLLTATAVGSPASQQLPAGLVREADLVYLGSFGVPSEFAYGGTGLALGPNADTIYLTTHEAGTMELVIPPLGGTAQIRQPGHDPFEGRLETIGGNGDRRVGGMLVYGDRLYMTAFIFYDAEGEQEKSHFSRPLDLHETGDLIGPVGVGRRNAGFYSGYMAPVPDEWREAFRGPAVTGNCCLSILGRTSFGPALFAFDPERMEDTTARPLVFYDEDHQTLGRYGRFGEVNPVFNGSTKVTGVVFPPGTASVLFFGATGVGPYCYGSAAACDDPSNDYQGEHAYPYKTWVWAYDANDLARVAAGRRNPWAVQPYATWPLDVLGNAAPSDLATGGAAYDPQTRRVYFLQRCATDNCLPLVRVFELRAPSPATADAASADARRR